MAELGLPIWVTELDIAQWDAKSRAKHLSYFLRAAFSHESVEGIILWGYWDQRHWKGKEASLADGPALTLNAAGNKYRDLVFREWWTQIKENSSSVNTRAFKGDYVIKALDENGNLIEKKTISLLENSKLFPVFINGLQFYNIIIIYCARVTLRHLRGKVDIKI